MTRVRTFFPLLAVLLVMLLLGGYGAYANNQVIVESERLRLRDRTAMVDSLAALSNVTYDGAVAYMGSSFADAPFTFAPDSAEDKATLGQITQALGALTLLAPDGTVRTMVTGRTDPPAADDPVYGEIRRRLEDGLAVSPTAFSRHGEPMVGFSTYVERDGAVAGIVVVFLRLDLPSSPNLFSAPVEKSTKGGMSGLLLLDDEGQVVGGDDLSWVGRRVDVNAAPWRQVMAGRGHARYDDGDVPRVVVHAPASSAKLVLAIVEDASAFYGSVRAERQRGMIATFVVILAAAVALIVLTYRRHRVLDHSERRLAALLGNAADAVLVVRDEVVVYAGPRTEDILLRPPDDLLGSRVDLLVPDVDGVNPVLELCTEASGAPGETCTTEVSFTTGGAKRWVMVSAVERSDDAAVGGVVLTFHDVTEQRLLHEQVVHQAWHDSLTGLPNRALFADRLDLALRQRTRRNRSVAVLFFDLDGFKPVNDTFGHNAGDLVLQAVARRCQGALRDGDTIARMGGDEFAVIAEGSSVHDVEGLARRLVAQVERPVDIGGQEVRIGVSVGVAVAEVADCLAPDDLLRQADLAMYEAKDGDGSVRVHGSRAECAVLDCRPVAGE